MESRYIGRLFFSSAVLVTALGSLLSGADSTGAGGQSFPTAEAAAKALVTAVESGDRANTLKILGPSAKELLTTSDPVADQRIREAFVKRAKEKVAVVRDPRQPTQRVVELGADRWPLPIPLVQVEGKWRFDLDQGKKQILLRRVGDDELNAIEVCRGYVEAQNEYFERDRTGEGVRQYAQKFISSPGQRDGLYWPSTDPKDESPIGDLVAKAIAEGYTERGAPYRGYYFKVLTGQGSHATGGAMNYMDGDAMTRGFALIAWPSGYGSTGVMTFLVDRAGIVYEKDLGENTDSAARGISEYDPDDSWKPVRGSGVPKTTTVTQRMPAVMR